MPAGAPAPDLRESEVALNPDNFWTAVHEGALIRRGMPRFETLTRGQVVQIYAYIRAGRERPIDYLFSSLRTCLGDAENQRWQLRDRTDVSE